MRYHTVAAQIFSSPHLGADRCRRDNGGTGRHVRVNLVNRTHASVVNHDTGMIATQKVRLTYATGVGDHADLVHHVLNIVLDPYRLIRRIEAALEPGIM